MCLCVSLLFFRLLGFVGLLETKIGIFGMKGEFFQEKQGAFEKNCNFAASWSRKTERKTNELSRREGRAIRHDTPRDNRLSPP